ncbi:hypothetical protein E4L96_18140 [Massilia arenosa]|uniref:DUF3300 domain-containing protein n=1 Tax=Zemynaea arenosa TaxID=2561931 RepID=A0A4Y9S6U4_9BURK|nr:hypothetical protein [Massilia arenosa]TFW15465.1 hypothetical protein E4L96_18140 [Massilia arenosa]
MKKLLLAAAFAGAALPMFAGAQTAVSISVGQPGFYGHIDIGGFAPPPVVYAQPVIVQRPVRVVEAPVVYLRAPYEHQRHWSRYCGRYNACGQRVYFVRDDWYLNTYAPRYREVHYRPEHYDRGPDRRDWDRHDDHGRGHGNGHGRGHDDHGNGHGRGHGKHGD